MKLRVTQFKQSLIRLANFSISNTGQITVIGELDRESIDDEQGQIKFIVMAIDHGHLPLTGTTEVTVKVQGF
jgi:hypothetical protein